MCYVALVNIQQLVKLNDKLQDEKSKQGFEMIIASSDLSITK